jgi:hypothetical protein
MATPLTPCNHFCFSLVIAEEEILMKSAYFEPFKYARWQTRMHLAEHP